MFSVSFINQVMISRGRPFFICSLEIMKTFHAPRVFVRLSTVTEAAAP